MTQPVPSSMLTQRCCGACGGHHAKQYSQGIWCLHLRCVNKFDVHAGCRRRTGRGWRRMRWRCCAAARSLSSSCSTRLRAPGRSAAAPAHKRLRTCTAWCEATVLGTSRTAMRVGAYTGSVLAGTCRSDLSSVLCSGSPCCTYSTAQLWCAGGRADALAACGSGHVRSDAQRRQLRSHVCFITIHTWRRQKHLFDSSCAAERAHATTGVTRRRTDNAACSRQPSEWPSHTASSGDATNIPADQVLWCSGTHTTNAYLHRCKASFGIDSFTA